MKQFTSLYFIIFLGNFVYKLTAFNISGIIEKYIAACGGKVCDRERFASGNKFYEISSKYGYVCPSCSCNISCIATGSCCPDVYFQIRPSCISTSFLRQNRKIYDHPFYIMKDKCPYGNSHNDTKERCGLKHDLEGQFENIPVTSTKSLLTYRNIHCSRCHNESEKDVVSWRLEIDCNLFADFNFLSSYAEIIDHATKHECNIAYIPGPPIENHIRFCNVSNPDTYNINTCNISGTWDKYDADVDFACQMYYNPYHNFKNVFCYMCNPPKEIGSVISRCNETGTWDTYDEELELSCTHVTQSSITVLFKNVYCFFCNRNNTDSAVGLKFKDASVRYTEYLFPNSNFVFIYEIDVFNLKTIQEEAEKRKQFSKTIMTDHRISIPKKKPFISHGDMTNETLNMTNIYLQLYAHEGNIAFCQNQSLFKSIDICSCERDCYFTNTKCCADMLFTRSTACTKKAYSLTGESYLVYDSCDIKSDLYEMCNNNSENNIFSILPVEAPVQYDTIQFKNIYCAMCNIENINVQKKFIFWRIKISCNVYFPPIYQISLAQYFKFAQAQDCKYSLEPQYFATQCSATDMRPCNLTGNWFQEDYDIKYACEHLNLPMHWYETGNPFCKICNPQGNDKLLYSTCNMTGLWEHFVEDIEDNCHNLPEIQSLFPYKNIFCLQCNIVNKYESDGMGAGGIGSGGVVAGRGIGAGGVGSGGMSGGGINTLWPPSSFRALFALSLYENNDNGGQINTYCNSSQIFDTGKDECRNLYCYPGRVLTKRGCIPLLPFATNLGYILSLRIKSHVQSRINNTKQFMTEIKDAFHFFLLTYLELSPKTLSFEETYFYTISQCDQSIIWYNTTVVDILIFEKIFITEFVNRTLLENKLISLNKSSFDASYMGSVYKFEINHEEKSFNLPMFISKISLTDHCFIKDNQFVYMADKFVHSYVNNMLSCKQVELESNEFELDYINLILTSYNEEISHEDYVLVHSGRTRICSQRFQELIVMENSVSSSYTAEGIVMRICMIISLVCLVFTFITYCLFSNLRSLPGINNMALVFAMFFAHFLFQFVLYANQFKLGCIIIGILIHFFWLATFGCLSICSFHMFRVFRSKTFINLSEKSRMTKTLIRYILFSYGCPMIIVLLNVIVGILTTGDTGYGRVICFLNEKVKFIVTFIAPITIICVCNIFFFVVTTIKIASTPKVEINEQNKSNQTHLAVYVKLFTLTGITWIFQIIDSFLPMSVFSIIVSFLNALQGVFIFVSYICNKRVLSLYKNLIMSSETSSSNHTQNNRENTMTTSLNSA